MIPRVINGLKPFARERAPTADLSCPLRRRIGWTGFAVHGQIVRPIEDPFLGPSGPIENEGGI
jgi:hypothetical protein